MADIVYPQESYAIIGACFSVYNDKGNGFSEPVYQECLGIEFELQAIPYDPQRELRLEYRGRTLKKHYVPDFVCYDKIILELKVVSQLTDEHRAQVLDYLCATGMQLGLLVNFGGYPDLEYERIVLSDPRRRTRPPARRSASASRPPG